MLSADVCQASVGSPPTLTDDGPMFQPTNTRCRWIVGGLSVERQQGIGRQSPDLCGVFNLSMSAGHPQMRKRYTNRHKSDADSIKFSNTALTNFRRPSDTKKGQNICRASADNLQIISNLARKTLETHRIDNRRIIGSMSVNRRQWHIGNVL
jgi:hypothetical protein